MIDTGLGALDLIDLTTKCVVVLVLLFITLRVLGRMQAVGPKRGGRLEVLETRSLAPKASLHLVAVGDKRLIVGLTPNGMVSLAELTKDELEAGDFALEFAAQQAAQTGATSATSATTAAGATPASTGRPLFPAGSPLNTLVRPIDAFADRLASAINGARAR
jgi:flagellar biosynthetic protein FliO